jgi:hypothetical protein
MDLELSLTLNSKDSILNYFRIYYSEQSNLNGIKKPELISGFFIISFKSLGCLGAVQKCLDARRAKTETRSVYGNTLSVAVCSAIPILSGQMSVL